ncbi:MAG: hypothetical protein KDK61_02380 [Simkania sp.]|uniref:Uncharacterized protein n=1 Tax=Simkania negevensis (strain ATCC VR-1471 / DSM 27360 / Z) TaxID=331113 RepID=F8L9U9_SIMNZ|nr:hypothetical protein [Simkania negevensis]MCB1067643.1 hypothetical protein [Simkania sp.]MCP5490716.1 hypothetical protein [Chlamydiales bacterium]MCB1074517.1 hypothetical protein [Simkania sp.]MCB1083132.1 hypothetical protein [Simkania sp.]CCB89652.1 unknown protein [Simkania negevensis Z]
MKYLLPILLLFSLCADAANFKLESLLTHLTSNDSSDNSDLTLDENRYNGKILKLSDGTLWLVAPQDVQTTQIWIFPFPLKIEKSDHPAYPYYLVNLRSGTKVLVRPMRETEKEALDTPAPEKPSQQQTVPPKEVNPNQPVAPPPQPTPLDH